MANSRKSSDSFTMQTEDEGQEMTSDVAEVAAFALEVEDDNEHLRSRVLAQQEQIKVLFSLVKGPPGRAEGNGPTADTPAVQRFRERMKVLKQAYPNTRI